MNLKTCATLAAILSLSACQTVPDPPDVDLCSMVWKERLDTSYLYCISAFNDSREYRVPAETAFKQKFVAQPLRHYGEVQKYVGELKTLARERCK